MAINNRVMKNFLIVLLPIILISILLYIIKINNISNVEKIKNTSEITIGYGFNSYVAIIKNSQEIKQLENMFNETKFSPSDINIKQPYLSISFASKDNSTLFCIDKYNTIKLEDGTHVTSNQIYFKELYSIFSEYSTKKE